MNSEKLRAVSWRARGIFHHLAEIAGDEAIDISADELVVEASDGVTSVRSGLVELVDAGLVERERARNSKGRLVGWTYKIAI